MRNRDCIFCKIVEGKIPSYKIGETAKFLAILDIARFTEGHTIIIPKTHYETMWDVPYIGEYFDFIQKVGNHFQNKGFRYVDTMTFGRMVAHSHVHLVPHNGDIPDWEKALSVIGTYQTDDSRRLSPEEGTKLVEKYSIS